LRLCRAAAFVVKTVFRSSITPSNESAFLPQVFELFHRTRREAGVVVVEEGIGFHAFVDDLF
jgi:hypothetical protein